MTELKLPNHDLPLGGAYGRVYKTADEARKHWGEGKDFRILWGNDMGRYCSIRDSVRMMGDNWTHVSIRIEAYPFVCRVKLTS